MSIITSRLSDNSVLLIDTKFAGQLWTAIDLTSVFYISRS